MVFRGHEEDSTSTPPPHILQCCVRYKDGVIHTSQSNAYWYLPVQTLKGNKNVYEETIPLTVYRPVFSLAGISTGYTNESRVLR